MGVNVMRTVFNLEPKYRVTMWTREEWTRGPRTPPIVKGLIWFTDGSRMAEGNVTGAYGQSLGRRIIISLGKHATVFQAEVCVKLACVYEIATQDRPEKYVSICSNSLVALKALQAAKSMSPLVQQCQKALNDISTQHTKGLYWILELAGVRGNEIADILERGGSIQTFIESELSLEVSRQNIKNNIKLWVNNQHLAMWHVHFSTQRQARKLISGPSPATKAQLLSFKRAQSRVVTGLLTGHNILRKHL
jgi:hypothetical protein